MTLIVPALVLAAAIGVVYWPIVTYPFIQDDWGQLNALVSSGSLKYFSDGVAQSGKLFYRPLSLAYFALYYRLFGLHPLPFHFVGLFIQFCSSLLVVFISWRLTRGCLIGWVAGFIYAAAVTVHLDPLQWLVGFYDLAGSFFYLASIALFLTKRRWLSAAAFGLAMLAKESTVVLGLAFPLILLYTDPPSKRSPGVLFRKLGPWASIVAAYCLVRMNGAITSFSLPETEPYSMHLFGIHILKNLFRYIWWSLEAVTPFRTLASDTVRWTIWGVTALAGILYVFRRKSPSPAAFPARWFGFLAAWAVIGIAPALFLPNHYYKYYLTYSLPPVVLLWLSALCWIYALLAEPVKRGTPDTPPPSPFQLPLSRASKAQFSAASGAGYPKVLTILFAALCLINVGSAAQYFHARDDAGISDRYVVGTNHLIHRGHAASLILGYLRGHHPSVPAGSVFLIDGCDLESVGNDAGLQAFYGDRSIRVFRLSDVVRDRQRRIVVKDGTGGSADRLQDHDLALQQRSVFCLRIRDGKVLEEDPLKAIEGE